MQEKQLIFKGLTSNEVSALQKQFGKNTFYTGTTRNLLLMFWDVVREPMFMILIVVCGIYFFLGNVYEGRIMLFAMMMVIATSLYQELRSANAIKGLRRYTQGNIKVIRDGIEVEVISEELVPGDIMLLSEGEQIPADGVVLQQNDCSVDEAIMTGESISVFKNVDSTLLQGTTITSGMCYAKVTKIGNQTALAKLGKSMEDIAPEKSLLQSQVNRFVQQMALVGLVAFLVVFGINYFSTNDLIISLLFGLVMTMSLIPEEIPVAFSSFMAIGAYRMSRIGLLVKQPITVESLGSASVICLDKTGTITENAMSLAAVYDFKSNKIITINDSSNIADNEVVAYSMWASEASPFDPMEKALHEAYLQNTRIDVRDQYRMVHEYPLEGKPPMMTHVWENADHQVIACKGAVERILRNASLGKEEERKILAITGELAVKGYRILGVAKVNITEKITDFPDHHDSFEWQFLGLVALYDPPKKGIRKVFEQFYEAGIQVKMLTGDYAETAVTIANESGFRNNGKFITGDETMAMSATDLKQVVKEVDLFVRMFPEAKLQIVEALKNNGEVVAMTGDGVNDGPALKAANIGVAMGNRGTDIAKRAASLVITDDNLDKMVDAIANGRKIYHNLKKAIRYIISIHIPIILMVLIPLLLNWPFKNIFTPVHIIFLEMIMGPTCSIFFENEPMEIRTMKRRPRRRSEGLFSWRELSGSILQGLIISIGVLGVYFWAMTTGHDEDVTRTMAFITLIISNVYLTLVNRSFQETIINTIRYKNNLLPVVLVASMVLLVCLQFIPFVRVTFHLTPLDWHDWLIAAAVAFVSVFWFEAYKFFKK
ncbi:MAG: cation-translocating P-type ATPase [Saprospiraceae bacterium]|nr:cation-translocating P-type ATPase [Saprospiraceae bacterium]